MSIKSIGQLLAEYLQEKSDAAPDAASKKPWDDLLQVALNGSSKKTQEASVSKPKIVKFIFRSKSDFVALLDNGSARIGVSWGESMDIPATDANFESVMACAKSGDESAVQRISDRLMSAKAPRDCAQHEVRKVRILRGEV